MSKEAMKLALEALVLNNDEWKSLADSGDSGYWKAEDQGHYQLTNEAITALREALAEQPAEFVTWGVDWGKAGDIPCVSIIKRLLNGGIEVVAVEYGPQRTWVSLTDDEISKVAIKSQDGISPHNDTLRFAKAIEAKLKEKNT